MATSVSKVRGIPGDLTAIVLLLCLGAPVHAAVVPSPVGASTFWVNRIPLIDEKLHEAAARAGVDLKTAKRSCDDAYFGVFEATEANMEIAVRNRLSAERAADLETKFGDIRKQIVARRPLSEIRAQIAQLDKALRVAATELDASKVRPQ